jgi:hypothetical protein
MHDNQEVGSVIGPARALFARLCNLIATRGRKTV